MRSFILVPLVGIIGNIQTLTLNGRDIKQSRPLLHGPGVLPALREPLRQSISRLQPEKGWQSSCVESVHVVVTNTTPGWTDLIMFLGAALALALAAETLFRRRR